MALNGIDVAKYQGNINLKNMPLDFVIIKFTQGSGYVNEYLDSQWSQAQGKLLGAYHYINGDGVQAEANHFVDILKKKGAIGKALIALDWEKGQNKVWGNASYLLQLANRVKALTGVTPFIYFSKSIAGSLSTIHAAGYPLWGAQYADDNTTGFQSAPWDDGKAWGNWGTTTALSTGGKFIRQYSSHGRISGYSGDLDLDLAYMTKAQWNAWAKGGTSSPAPVAPNPSISKVQTATRWMETTANDDSHGYDQRYRWGEKGDYDCSSSVITAWQSAGVPVKTKGATYTGNMRKVFLSCGFKDVTTSVNLATGSGLKRGDVLLNDVHHTAMSIGNGKIVQASINEKGGAIGGAPGDQTGKEFYIRSYYNYPWNCVLRYGDGVASTPSASTVPTKAIVPRLDIEINTPHHGKSGKKQNEVSMADDQINGISIGTTGGWIEYRVHTVNGKWYSKITKCDWKTPDAYAGDLKNAIDAIQMYFHTDTKQTGGVYYSVEYQVKIPGGKWLGKIKDTNWESTDGNHTAGVFGQPIIAIRAKLVRS